MTSQNLFKQILGDIQRCFYVNKNVQRNINVDIKT